MDEMIENSCFIAALGIGLGATGNMTMADLRAAVCRLQSRGRGRSSSERRQTRRSPPGPEPPAKAVMCRSSCACPLIRHYFNARRKTLQRVPPYPRFRGWGEHRDTETVSQPSRHVKEGQPL